MEMTGGRICMKAASASKKKGVLKKTRNSRTIWNYHIMVLIGMVWLFFFNIVPMFGIVIAFEDYNPMSGLWHSDFVGMENFAYLFSMSDCKRVIINTLVIAVAKLILNIIVPLAFALLLNEIRQVKFKKAVQTIVYLPHFLSWAIIGSVAMTMFRPNSGLVNILLTNLGVISEGIPFLNEKWHWAVTYLLIGVWQTMGWGTILYLAAITGINGELYEAAMIDGANRWKRMWHITLPGIKSTVVTLLILNLGRVMGSNLERLTALENSQVKDFQYQLAVYIYNKGIGAGKFSAATAVGLFQSLIGLILVLLSDKFAKKLGEDGLL